MDNRATDAHVACDSCRSQLVSVTYTDVHRVRAKFFSSLFETWNVEWSVLAEHEAGSLGKEDVFNLMTGRFAAENAQRARRFLTFWARASSFSSTGTRAAKHCRPSLAEHFDRSA